MDLGLGGKVVVVTGGAKGIGAAIIRAAAAEGMTTVIVDRDEAASTELAAGLRSAGHMVEVVIASLDRAEACAEAVEWAYRESGSDGLRHPGAIGRCFRDMYAGTQHLFVSRKTLVDAANALLADG